MIIRLKEFNSKIEEYIIKAEFFFFKIIKQYNRFKKFDILVKIKL